MHTTLEQVWQQAQTLPPEQLEELKKRVEEKLETKDENKPQMTEEEFEKHLAETGFTTGYKPPITDFSRYENYKPIEVSGEPLSEMIIRERR